MISIFVLIVLALLLGSYEGKNPGEFDSAFQLTIKWAAALTSPLWLGVGLLGMFAVFLIYQTFFTAAKNISIGESIWFIDKETWLAQYIVKYTGEIGGKVLFFIEIFLAIIILL